VQTSASNLHKVTPAGLLIALGIIYGDIGTSPLYVMKAIINNGGGVINETLVYGGLSCVFWTITLQTTLKYVVITLNADNNGEGGIFSLYALLRRRKIWWLWIPAIIGGSTLLADGMITPPISVSSAIEGLRILYPDINTIPIVLGIIAALFIFQQFGTGTIGKAFGPVMMAWFLMLAALGVNMIIQDVEVLKAVNPYYAYTLLVKYPQGFWLLGAVFLCTTGAEALYSDLGHCGRGNIRVTWIFVKACLLLNYFGQGAWLLLHQGAVLNKVNPANPNPFYLIMPEWFVLPGIAIATLAAIIASQAMISGSFTLINEGMRLNFWPKMRVAFPTEMRGQIYIPAINWLLFAGCCGVVLYFRESSSMEHAYGLAIVMTFLMTTVLLFFYLTTKRLPLWIPILVMVSYLFIEGSFLAANLVKFVHGGWVSLLIGFVFIAIMVVWYRASRMRNELIEFEDLDKHLPLLRELSDDETVPKYATHLVYLTKSPDPRKIESKILYSIFKKQPKRADIYWFVHVEVMDDPYTMEYSVDTLAHDDMVRIDFRLGFRVDQRINLMFRAAVEDLVKNGEVDIMSRYKSLKNHNIMGDFRFIIISKVLTIDNKLGPWQKFITRGHNLLKTFSISDTSSFGLDSSSVTIERVPLIVVPSSAIQLKRV
jgi:KUP system potassium uptake protein